MAVESHLEPAPRVLRVAGILETILVALDKEFQMIPEEGEGERDQREGEGGERKE